MRCIVSGCDIDRNCTSTSKGVTFHSFPTEPKLREIWLKSLEKKSWEYTEDSAVCSKHFQEDDLYVSSEGQCIVRAGAVPVAYMENIPKRENWMTPCHVKVCRICFATDCNLYSMTSHKKLGKAYETLSGLQRDNTENKLSPYLCIECSHRLLNCIQFRARSIQASLILQEIVQKHDYLTLEAIKSCNGYHNLRSKLGVTHKRVDQYDLEIEHVEKENKYTVQQGHMDASSNLYDVSLVKVEKDEDVNQDIEDQDTTYGPPRLHEVIVPGIKLENDDLYTHNSSNHEHTTNEYKALPTLHDAVGIKIKVETIEMTNQQYAEDDDSLIPNGEVSLGEDYSSDDDLSLGEQELEGNLTRKVKKVKKVPNNYNKGAVDQHWVPLSESAEMVIINDKLPNEIYVNTNTQTKLTVSKKTIHKSNEKKDTQFHGRIKSSKNQEYFCRICNKTFSRKHKLQLHLKIHSGDKPYSCEMCESSFITKHMLSIHMRIHSGEKPYKCNVCEKSFSQKGNLNKHLRIHSGEKPYSCSVCVKSFAQKSNLSKHFKTHSGEKPYLCELCNRGFNQLGHLENHMRTHSGEKPYSCNVCNKLFTIKCNLQKHLRVHSGEKRYSCQYCNKGFNENNRFQTHLRVHLGEKPFACNVCEKSFSAKSCLQSHLKIHSDEKPFECNFCNKAFRHRNRLVTHLTIHSL